MSRPHIVFCSQEVWPFVEGGGVGRYIAETARRLAEHADVTIVAPGSWRERHGELVAAADLRLPPARFVWVEEPEGDVRPFVSWYHAYSYRCWIALRDLAREHTPSLVEFEDYRGVGAVTVQAKRSSSPELHGVPIVVRVHTSWELTQRLDGTGEDDAYTRALSAIERIALLFADRVHYPARATRDAYEAYYGADALGPGELVATPFARDDTPLASPPDGPLRLLYVGRLQRLKGVVELVQEVVALDDQEVSLHMVGADTETGPGGGSMRDHLRGIAGDDPRIKLSDAVSPERLSSIIDAHHVVVVPSSFEAFGYVAREALARNRPIIARRVGGLAQLFDQPGAGWPIEGGAREDLRATLAAVANDPAEVARMITEQQPIAALVREIDSADVVEPYMRVAAAADETAVRTPDNFDGEVTAIVTALGRGDLDATLASLAGQVPDPPEVVVLASDEQIPSSHAIDQISVLETVGAEGGRLAARRRGLELRSGRGPVLFLDTGQTLHTDFVERAGIALGCAHDAAYVTAYGDGITLGNAPLGNAVASVTGEPHLSGRIALFAADVLTRPLPEPRVPGFEDEALFEALADRGAYGVVVPQRLTGPVRPPRPVAVVAPADRRQRRAATAVVPPGEDSADLAATFSKIYDDTTWTDRIPGMPRSGRGALPGRSAPVIGYLQDEIASGRIASIADIGCGDLAYVREIPEVTDGRVDYLGIDVVPELINNHRSLPWGQFELGDITASGFRVDADVVICKDVLFHLSDMQVRRALENLAASSWRELIVTSQPTDGGPRIFDRWHYAPLDLEAAPYGLKATRRLARADGGAYLIVERDELRVALSDA